MHYSLARATIWNLFGYLYLIVASLIATDGAALELHGGQHRVDRGGPRDRVGAIGFTRSSASKESSSTSIASP